MNLPREDIIRQLTDTYNPAKRVCFNRIWAELIGICALSLLILGAAYGLRADIASRLQDPLFVIEITLHLGLIVTASYTSAALGFPDRAYHRGMHASLYVVAAAYIGFSLYLASGAAPMPTEMSDHGLHGIACTGCMLSFAFVPALFGVWRVMKLAHIRPLSAGFAAFLAAGGTGSLGLILVESETTHHGLFTWHVVPFLLLALFGIYTGKKIFTSL